jgi:hypothetical protein
VFRPWLKSLLLVESCAGVPFKDTRHDRSPLLVTVVRDAAFGWWL